MELKIDYPYFEYGENPPAVYIMKFDTGHFYIGSSKRVKTRLVLWRTSIKNWNFSSKTIKDILPSVREIVFEIIEMPKPEFLKERETYYIQQHFNNPLLMNRYSNGFNNPGIKPLSPHLKKPRKLYGPKGKMEHQYRY